MELFSPNIKKFQKTETPKKIPYISGNRNPKKASYCSGNGTFQSTPKKFLILQEKKITKKLLIFSQKKAVLAFREMETLKTTYISGSTSKAPKAKLYYVFPNKVMSKFFKKHFRIIVSIIYINRIKQYYRYIKTLKAIFCVESFSSF